MQALAIAITDNSAIVGYIGNGQNHTTKHIEARKFYRVRDAAVAMQIGMCGCRWLGLGTPFASDVKKGTIYADTPLHGNDDGLLLTHREAITQTGTK